MGLFIEFEVEWVDEGFKSYLRMVGCGRILGEVTISKCYEDSLSRISQRYVADKKGSNKNRDDAKYVIEHYLRAEGKPKFSFKDNPLINKVLSPNYITDWALRKILDKQVGGMP